MQAALYTTLSFAGALFFFQLNTACKKTESFEAAKSKYHATLVDQVNTVKDGAPFFTVDTLNPIWSDEGKSPIVRIPSLRLIDQDASPRDESLFSQKISFVGFMFASCHGFCPILIDGMRSVERELGDLAAASQFIALTVNPEEDTPERLRDYAKQHKLDTSKSWMLLTGDKETIYSLARSTFASQVFKRPTSETNFVHSEHLYVIDAKGRLRGILNGTRTDLKRDARKLAEQLLAEPDTADRVSLAPPDTIVR